jgi:hypothetical protein
MQIVRAEGVGEEGQHEGSEKGNAQGGSGEECRRQQRIARGNHKRKEQIKASMKSARETEGDCNCEGEKRPTNLLSWSS